MVPLACHLPLQRESQRRKKQKRKKQLFVSGAESYMENTFLPFNLNRYKRDLSQEYTYLISMQQQ